MNNNSTKKIKIIATSTTIFIKIYTATVILNKNNIIAPPGIPPPRPPLIVHQSGF